MSARSQRGGTLIELVLAIVIITATAGTIVGLLGAMSRSSADAMMQSQSASIANAYLNEILGQSFSDPDGTPDFGRNNTDDIDDYARADVLPDTTVRDRDGNAVASLSSYSVAVFITQPGLNGIPNADTRLVRVEVTNPLNEITPLSGFRTRSP
jgi:MSHA pilin protein MshD